MVVKDRPQQPQDADDGSGAPAPSYPFVGRSVRVVGNWQSVDANQTPHEKNKRGELGKLLSNWYFNRISRDPLGRIGSAQAVADRRNLLSNVVGGAPKGQVNPRRAPVHDPKALTKHIKRVGKAMGADIVGIAAVHPSFLYAGGRYPEDGTGMQGNGAAAGETPEELATQYPLRHHPRRRLERPHGPRAPPPHRRRRLPHQPAVLLRRLPAPRRLHPGARLLRRPAHGPPHARCPRRRHRRNGPPRHAHHRRPRPAHPSRRPHPHRPPPHPQHPHRHRRRGLLPRLQEMRHHLPHQQHHRRRQGRLQRRRKVQDQLGDLLPPAPPRHGVLGKLPHLRRRLPLHQAQDLVAHPRRPVPQAHPPSPCAPPSSGPSSGSTTASGARSPRNASSG